MMPVRDNIWDFFLHDYKVVLYLDYGSSYKNIHTHTGEVYMRSVDCTNVNFLI